jgi:hypothetical protein
MIKTKRDFLSNIASAQMFAVGQQQFLGQNQSWPPTRQYSKYSDSFYVRIRAILHGLREKSIKLESPLYHPLALLSAQNHPLCRWMNHSAAGSGIS